MQQVKILIIGKVQGINYRNFIYSCATKLGLKGYVKNIDLDKVEVLAVGSKQLVEKLISQIKSYPYAKIDKINVEFNVEFKGGIDFVGQFDEFKIIL